MQLPVTLLLQPSRRLALLLLAAHGGTAFAASLISIDLWIKFVFFVVVFLSAVFQLAKLYGRKRVVRLTLYDDGLLEYLCRDADSAKVKIHPHSTVSSLLAVLLIRRDKRLDALVVVPDSMGREEFRTLRLWLRWFAMKGETTVSR